MFKCQISGKISKSGEKSYKIVTKTRARTYSNANSDKVSHGNEIVEEKTVCFEVYSRFIDSQVN